jgi:sulfatase modifying factor 1
MLTQIRKKILQKDIKKYSELHIDEWWNVGVGLGIFKHYNSTKQRYSKSAIKKSCEKPSLAQGKIPYYKVNEEIYNMIPCLSGSFMKGSNRENDDNPLEKMNIEKSFLLGETEITQELYKSVMCVENPSFFKDNPKNPVEQVSWYDALIFCNRLSDIFGIDRYYTIFKIGMSINILEENQNNYLVGMNEASKGFRLPTEWEWEYAAKAGTPLKYSGSNKSDEVAWFGKNSKVNGKATTHPVKQKIANAWGFYDMSGNVFEWCENKYNDTDPKHRATRGGDWERLDVSNLHIVSRFKEKSARMNNIGFRVCKYI